MRIHGLALALVLTVLVGGVVEAAPHSRRCPPTCKHRLEHPTKPAPCPAPAPAPVVVTPAPRASLWDEFTSNIEVRAGFRWEEECGVCPSLAIPAPPPPVHKDPPFVGLGLRISSPSDRVGLYLSVDRNWEDKPVLEWGVAGYWKPFKRRAP
jgi:hypothetical protein